MKIFYLSTIKDYCNKCASQRIEKIKKNFSEIRDEINSSSEEIDKSLYKNTIYGMLLPVIIPSAIFILLFFPATIVSSYLNNLQWSDIILFDIPLNSVTYKYKIFPVPSNGSKIEYPLLFSLLTSYGSIGLAGCMILCSNSLFRIFVSSIGIYWGYHMVYSSVYMLTYLGLFNSKLHYIELFNMKLIYIFLIFYLFESLTDLFAKNDYRGDKFRFLFPGLQGLTTGWVLEKVFNNNAAIFNGIAFMLCCFTSIFIIEISVTKIIYILNRYGFQFKNYSEYIKPVMFDNKIFIDSFKKNWHSDKEFIVAGGVINAAFPFIIYIFYKLVLL